MKNYLQNKPAKMKLLFLILVLVCADTVYSDDTQCIGMFPHEIGFWPVEAYINFVAFERELNNKEIYELYMYILQFIEDAMIAVCNNIRNFFERCSLTVLVPAFNNGSLVIKEIHTVLAIFDFELDQYIEAANIDVVSEIVTLLSLQYTFNQLIEHWGLLMQLRIFHHERMVKEILEEIKRGRELNLHIDLESFGVR